MNKSFSGMPTHYIMSENEYAILMHGLDPEKRSLEYWKRVAKEIKEEQDND